MATYTAAQLQGGGVLSTETFDPTSEENEVVKLGINLPLISTADRNHADVGQCALFIETINLGTNPTVGARDTTPPFGRNPNWNYMEAGRETEGFFKTNILNDVGSYGFFPQRPQFIFSQTITFSSLGIQHNLLDVPGSNCSPEPELAVPFERCYLPQIAEGRKIAAFTFSNNITVPEGGTKTFYWYPSTYVPMYGNDGGTFFYGGVRFRGVGDFSLTTATIPILAG
tara:strand:- start:1685 stop:2365 length:681 start_codon:yes stop_codon:yes gene_type:complete